MTLDAFLRHFASTLPAGSLWAVVIALVAGVVASAVCPCTLPVGIGLAGVSGTTEGQSRRAGFVLAVAFFLGVVVNLTFLGALAGRLGVILSESFGRYWTLAMAVVSLVAAVVAFVGPRLRTEQLAALRRSGFVGAFGYGFVFSLGTSAAPLVLLLTVAAAQARPLYGLVLAFAFGVGRGSPFLIAGLFAGAISRLTRLGSLSRRWLRVGSGTALLLVSAYYGYAFTAYL